MKQDITSYAILKQFSTFSNSCSIYVYDKLFYTRPKSFENLFNAREIIQRKNFKILNTVGVEFRKNPEKFYIITIRDMRL